MIIFLFLITVSILLSLIIDAETDQLGIGCMTAQRWKAIAQKLVSLEDAVYAALKNPEEYRIPTILPKSMRARAAAAVKVVAKHKRRREEGRGR